MDFFFFFFVFYFVSLFLFPLFSLFLTVLLFRLLQPPSLVSILHLFLTYTANFLSLFLPPKSRTLTLSLSNTLSCPPVRLLSINSSCHTTLPLYLSLSHPPSLPQNGIFFRKYVAMYYSCIRYVYRVEIEEYFAFLV